MLPLALNYMAVACFKEDFTTEIQFQSARLKYQYHAVVVLNHYNL